MPEISVGAQIFDVVFHPTAATVYTGLLTGHVKGYAYDDQGNQKLTFNVRPSKSSCRGLSLNQDGSRLYAVGKGKSLSILDTTTETVDLRARAHETSINRVKHLMPWLLATGDDEGVIKLWDPRQKEAVREYTQHFDYITDFLWLNGKKQLVATSGDGTLSVIDVRSKASKSVAQSEDQEDELLSIVSIKGGAKVAVGTQLGILSIFNPKNGWGDCVDRIPGHPLSVDTMCALPEELPSVDTQSTILTGSSDGFVRAIQILPSKLLGVVADHGEWPIERIAVGGCVSHLTVESNPTAPAGSRIAASQKFEESEEHKSSGTWWIASVGHDEVLRLTDLEAFFQKSHTDAELSHHDSEGADHEDDDSDDEVALPVEEFSTQPSAEEEGDTPEEDIASKKRTHTEKGGSPPAKKKKRMTKKKVIDIESAFFDGL
ncbi:WD40-repeat-containing domain protein [Crepidotus variabilis]|uniref:WD repeat-containing protein JIP5 n=1 Tax=Crepidotus variabilis TaxID=179855 RepID=A0A9P6EIZ3_9AGAR|nr:WD40-repeat-containing domain protein [Crepidotus variabilis]